MEGDLDFRNRVLRYVYSHKPDMLVLGWYNAMTLAAGADLDRLAAEIDFRRKTDPFGDAVRVAQEKPNAPAPSYTPDDFTAPGFDADEAYRRAMGD